MTFRCFYVSRNAGPRLKMVPQLFTSFMRLLHFRGLSCCPFAVEEVLPFHSDPSGAVKDDLDHRRWRRAGMVHHELSKPFQEERHLGWSSDGAAVRKHQMSSNFEMKHLYQTGLTSFQDSSRSKRGDWPTKDSDYRKTSELAKHYTSSPSVSKA
jgi:hypothetical protein